MRKVAGRRRVRKVAVLAALLMALGVLSACGSEDDSGQGDDGDGGEVTTLRVALGWIPNVEFGGFWIADDAGYYEDEGLDIEWLPGGPEAPNPESAVAAGDADLGLSPDLKTLIDSISSGDEFAILGAVYQKGPGCLLSLADDPVTSPEDMSGKSFLAQDEAVVDTLFKVNGLEPDYKFVPTGFDPGPLVEGEGDAYTAYITNQAVTMETAYGLEDGKDFQCVLYADMGYPLYSSTIFGNASELEAKREAVIGFLRASARGWIENADDPERAANLAVNEYGADLGLDIEQQVLQNERQIPLTHSDYTEENGMLRVDPDHLGGPVYDGLTAGGSTDLPAVEDIVDQTYLDEVYRDGLEP